MNAALRQRPMTREEFFDWARDQAKPYEFDGFQPVAMTGGTLRHDQITQNILLALAARLEGGACRPFGPNAGMATAGFAVRYPDALVTCAKIEDGDRLAPQPLVAFEVVSPSSERNDRIVKLTDYAAVGSLRRYVIMEHDSVGLTSFERPSGDRAWTVTAPIAGEVLRLTEIGIEVPVIEFYQRTSLLDAGAAEPAA